MYNTFISKNDIKLTATTPIYWEVLNENADGTGPLFYKVYVDCIFMDGYNCIFQNNIVSIYRVRYSADEPSIKFKVNSIEEAGELVLNFVTGMNYLDEFKQTIYFSK
jgi:hypothetical protein